MVSLDIPSKYLIDLKYDFLSNKSKTLYELIDGDPARAFYIGIYSKKWFDLLEEKKKYLYSKDFCHLPEQMQKYRTQLEYWVKKYNSSQESDEVDTVKLSEYVLNIIVFDSETEEQDLIKLALFLGMGVGQSIPNLPNEESI